MKPEWKKLTAVSKRNKAKYKLKRAIEASGLIESAVTQAVKYSGETKYSADDILVGGVVTGIATTPADFKRCIPRVGQGVQENQRVGDRITPTKARVYIQYWFAAGSPNMVDVTVHCAIVTVKGAFTAAAVGAIPAAKFLKVGDGTNRDPDDPNNVRQLSVVAHMPINTDQYTVLKYSHIRMSKGAGAINGAPGTPAESGDVCNKEATKIVKYSWKPPQFKYNDTADVLPSNHYPVLLTWATANDGSALQANTIEYTIRTDMFFKDK